MLLDKHERKYKRFIALQKESNEISAKKRALPWTEVKPYQDGWFIHIEFRDEVKRRDDYPYLKAALDAVHKKGRTRSPKVVSALRNMKRIDQMYAFFHTDKWGNYVAYASNSLSDAEAKTGIGYTHYSYGNPPVLARCSVKKYETLHPAVQKWLYKVTDNTKYWGDKEWYKSNIPDHFLRVKVRPAYVTHEQNIDPQLEKREAEVDKELSYLGWDFYTNYRAWWGKVFGNRALRAAERAAMRKFIKGETEDFEIKQRIKDYD